MLVQAYFCFKVALENVTKQDLNLSYQSQMPIIEKQWLELLPIDFFRPSSPLFLFVVFYSLLM